METTKSVFEAKNISSEKVVSLISELLGKQGYPDPDNPHPAGPWDPYIRKGVERVKIFGIHPEPWRFSYFAHLRPEIWDAIHPHSLTELNPQSLPPLSVYVAAITQEVIDRAVLMQDIADAINQTKNERSIVVVNGFLEKYAEEFDELCPRMIDILISFLLQSGFVKPPRPNWVREFSALDFLAVAAVFHQNSLNAANQNLHQPFYNTAVKFAEFGMDRRGA
ncbi:MAG: hypothetical protein JWR38_807 [Mucilaginibacter sp.]|nr:hypothetical protein [Mucilaginibacter sp.]